ncbi:uroporphyrinogen-III C-methyltransferase [Dasania marina]|uniref:uroporphyrinogen-III C-methyltransferase n=1 Tax=Dasania marina TaxID=471499 RepID=UPI0030D71437
MSDKKTEQQAEQSASSEASATPQHDKQAATEDDSLNESLNENLVKQKTAAMKNNDSSAKKTQAKASSENKSSTASNPGNNSTKSSTKSSANNVSNNVKKATAKPSKALSLVALIIALIAVLACVYLWQQGGQQQGQLATEVTELQQQLQQQEQQLQRSETTVQRALAQQAASNKESQQQLVEQLNALHLTVKGQQQRLQSLSTTDREDWLLAEAEYLMKLANQRLLMGKELAGASELLTAADAILRDFDDAALYAVRKILAQEITALKSAARFDMEGLYLRIGALAQQVEQIDLFKAPQLTVAATEQTTVAAPSWQQRVSSAIEQAKHKLSQYIQINRREQVYKPMLAPDQEAAIRHNLRLMFEQAQLALLAGKQTLYEQSLLKSQQWLNDYFAINPEQVDTINDMLEKLKQQAVTVELPDISASSRALKTYIETRHDLPKKKSQPAQQKNNESGEEGSAL